MLYSNSELEISIETSIQLTVLASTEIGISGGNNKVCFQLITFR